jgi:hypothetical protein
MFFGGCLQLTISAQIVVVRRKSLAWLVVGYALMPLFPFWAGPVFGLTKRRRCDGLKIGTKQRDDGPRRSHWRVSQFLRLARARRALFPLDLAE